MGEWDAGGPQKICDHKTVAQQGTRKHNIRSCSRLTTRLYGRVITSGKAGGLASVNRSKRLWLLFAEPPKVAGMVKPGAPQEGYFLNSFNCSSRLSSASCS